MTLSFSLCLGTLGVNQAKKEEAGNLAALKVFVCKKNRRNKISPMGKQQLGISLCKKSSGGDRMATL